MPDADVLAVSGEPDEVRQLLAMLRRDPDLRSAGLALAETEPAPGELGALADTLIAIVTNEALLTAVASTVGVWLHARLRPTRIKVRKGDVEIEVVTGKAKRAEDYTREILDRFAEPDEE
jgi:hypothetical protein